MLYKYEQGTGRIEALQFLLRIKNQDVAFSLPVHWRKFQRVLELQQVRRWDEEEYVYRVAWRNIRDWVMEQNPRSSRQNELPVKRINGSLLMGHEYLASAAVELRQIRKTSSGPDHVLHHAPEAFDGVEVVPTMGR